MIITIRLKTDNAAFGDDPTDRHDEVARILRAWAARIPEDGYSATLHDSNGNTVGSVTVTGR